MVDGGTYAVKILQILDSSERADVREVKHLQELRHHNIVRYHFSFLDTVSCDCLVEQQIGFDEFLIIQMELCERTLDGAIRGADGIGLSVTFLEVMQRLLQILEAVGYLHSNRVIHRDIKPVNCHFLKIISGQYLHRRRGEDQSGRLRHRCESPPP